MAATTIRSVLLGAGIPPAGRRSQLTWKQFLAAHAESLVAADFFSVDTIFFERLYVLLFVHLATRQVLAATCTAEPNELWMTQQARNLSWKLADQGINLSVVIHDRDRKFAPKADAVFKSEGARVIVTPLMAPMSNALAERWLGSCRRECLDWMLIVNQRYLEAVLRESACTTTVSARIGVGTCDHPLPVAIPFNRLGLVGKSTLAAAAVSVVVVISAGAAV